MNTQFSMPTTGAQVKITFSSSSYLLGSEGVIQTTLNGTVESPTKFTPTDYIRLKTDFDSPVLIREIPINKVIVMDYLDGRKAGLEPVDNHSQKWTVEGSRGSNYTVVKDPNSWSCTCPGFQFRGTCKHIQSIKT
jgi:hypothetical protein